MTLIYSDVEGKAMQDVLFVIHLTPAPIRAGRVGALNLTHVLKQIF